VGDPDADAEERLRRAQDRLAEAIRQSADPDEIDELMQELREATREALRERARNAPPDAGDSVDQGERQEITGDQIQQMLDRIQELMDQGRIDEALALLEQLQELLENLEVTQGDGGEGGEGDNPMSGLGETLRDQQDLADETFRDLQEQFGQQPGTREGQDGRSGEGEDPSGRRDGEQAEGETRNGEGGGDAAGGDRDAQAERDLAARQRALRDALRDQQAEAIPGDGTEQGAETRRALDEAERAMEEAEDRLRQGDAAGALDRQARAIEQMREGLRGMNEALARRNGETQPGDEGEESGSRSARLDPLGREMGPNGAAGVDDPMLQGEGVDRRAQEILDEIRRRSAERDRPEAELDYLGRLLDRF
jgi:tetratricopeptide (TPR) repeat protein